MKIFRKPYGLLLLLALLFIRCNNDNEINLLIGTWIGVTVKVDALENGTLINSVTEDASSFTMFLREDGTFSFIDSDNPDGNDSGTWSQLTGNQIQTIGDDGFISTADILTLNKTTLIIETSEESTNSGVTFKDISTLTFDRQTQSVSGY